MEELDRLVERFANEVYVYASLQGVCTGCFELINLLRKIFEVQERRIEELERKIEGKG